MVQANVPWTHGAYVGGRESSEHAIWRGMMARCHRPGSRDFPRYGGRGIRVCVRWLTYENFLADMGARPQGLTLERRDNDGDYTPDNCVWATTSEQQKNRRDTVRWSENGVVGTLVEWAERLGISKQLAAWRMKNWGTFVRGRTWHR